MWHTFPYDLPEVKQFIDSISLCPSIDFSSLGWLSCKLSSLLNSGKVNGFIDQLMFSFVTVRGIRPACLLHPKQSIINLVLGMQM